MTPKQFAAVLGFAFVAAWVAFGFGEAILCLLGAGLAWLLAGVVSGDVDLGDVQARVRSASGGS